jgi:hypothetical protein
MRARWSMVFVLVVCGLLADVHAQLRSRVHASGFESPVAFFRIQPIGRSNSSSSKAAVSASSATALWCPAICSI